MRVSRMKCFAVVMLAFASISASKDYVACEGFVPENDLAIPVGALMVSNVTEADFNKVLDVVEAYYAPIVADLGGRLSISRKWNDPTVNASAQRSGRTYKINMYGGLARHPTITVDAFMMVACHEMGHHLGGYPKIDSWMGTWATNEGGADYFANLRCLRALFTDADNARYVDENKETMDPYLRQTCEEQYSTQEEENFCMRAAMAGMSGAMLFKELRNETVAPRFDTPDIHEVDQIDDSHPGTQCRLDTYFNGSLCNIDQSEPISDSDPQVGACTHEKGFDRGLRPRCWFK